MTYFRFILVEEGLFKLVNLSLTQFDAHPIGNSLPSYLKRDGIAALGQVNLTEDVLEEFSRALLVQGIIDINH